MSKTPQINLKVCAVFQSLCAQHQKFVLAYLKTFNATKAAKEAKYSKKTARSQGQRLLTKADIQKAIAEVKSQLDKSDIADVQEVMQFLTSIMRSNIKDVVGWNEDGLTFTASSEKMDSDTSRLIKKIKVTERTSQEGDWTESKTEVELHDPVRAAELLGRYHGAFKDKVEHSGKVDLGVEPNEVFTEWLQSSLKK